jgi:hypothetical protein
LQKFSISHKRQTDEISAGAAASFVRFAQKFPKVGDFNAVYHCITFILYSQYFFAEFSIFLHILLDTPDNM